MRVTIPGMTLSTIGPGMWDCSQLAKTQIVAVASDSKRAQIVARYLGIAIISAITTSDTNIAELATVAFHYARKVIR